MYTMYSAIYVLLTPEVVHQLMTTATLKLPPMGPSRLREVHGTLILTSDSDPRRQVMQHNTVLFYLSFDQIMDAVRTGAPRLTIPQVASALAICPWVPQLLSVSESLGGMSAVSTNPTAESMVMMTHAQLPYLTPIQRYELDIQSLAATTNAALMPPPTAPLASMSRAPGATAPGPHIRVAKSMVTHQRYDDRLDHMNRTQNVTVDKVDLQPSTDTVHQASISSRHHQTASISHHPITLSTVHTSKGASITVPILPKHVVLDSGERKELPQVSAADDKKRSKSNINKCKYRAGNILKPYPNKETALRDMVHIFGGCMRQARGGDPNKPVYRCRYKFGDDDETCDFTVALRHNCITKSWEFQFDTTDKSTNKHLHQVRYELPLPESMPNKKDHTMNRFLRHHFVEVDNPKKNLTGDMSRGLSKELGEIVDNYCKLNLNATPQAVMSHITATHPRMVGFDNASALLNKISNRIKNRKQASTPRNAFIQPLWTHNALMAYHSKYKLPRDASIDKLKLRQSGSAQDIADVLNAEILGCERTEEVTGHLPTTYPAKQTSPDIGKHKRYNLTELNKRRQGSSADKKKKQLRKDQVANAQIQPRPQFVRNILPGLSGKYIKEELSTFQGQENANQALGCQYFSFYFAITHACELDVGWRSAAKGNASSLPNKISKAVHADTRKLFISVEANGCPLEKQPLVDQALAMVTKFLDLGGKIDKYCQYAIRTDRMDPELERLHLVIGRKLEKYPDRSFSMVFLFQTHMVSVLRYQDDKGNCYFVVVDTLGVDGSKNGSIVTCDSKDSVINAIMHRYRDLTIEPVKDGKFGNKTDVNDPFAFVCAFFRNRFKGEPGCYPETEANLSDLSEFVDDAELDKIVAALHTTANSPEAVSDTDIPDRSISIMAENNSTSGKGGEPSDSSDDTSDNCTDEEAATPKPKQLLIDISDESSDDSSREVAAANPKSFARANPKPLSDGSGESSDDSSREVLEMPNKSIIDSSRYISEYASDDRSSVTCGKVINLINDDASDATETDTSAHESQASTASQGEIDSDDSSILSATSVDLQCMPWKALSEVDHRMAREINDEQHANFKITVTKAGKKVYSLKHKTFWKIPRLKNIIQPPTTVLISHGVVNTDLACCSMERFYNRRSNRRRRKKGRLSNTEDDQGGDPMWVNDEGMGAVQQVYHTYHWDRPEFEGKRVCFLAPLAFNQLLPLSSTKITPLTSHRMSELESALWKSKKRQSRPHGYEYDEKLLRRPGGGVRYKRETRVNIFEEVVNVVMPVNIPGYHWFAVNFNVTSKTIQVFDWLGGKHAYHEYAALIMKNWLVDERLYWVNRERELKKQNICPREQVWRQMVDDRDHPYCLQKTEYNCRRDQMDGNTCGVRVCLLMLYILLGIDEKRYSHVMTNERELQKSRRWLMLCIANQRLLITGNMVS